MGKGRLFMVLGAQTSIAGTAVRTPGRVLLVVDHPVLAEGVKLALNHGRFHTEIVSTAEEALAAVAQRRPHLAVIDMDLAQGHMLDQLASSSTCSTDGAATAPNGWPAPAASTAWACRLSASRRAATKAA